MKKILLATCLLCLSLQPLNALLAPIYQSIKEIETILHSQELISMVSPSESIQDIQRVENGYYVVTNHSEIFVEIVYQASGPGPQRFQLIFHEPQKLN